MNEIPEDERTPEGIEKKAKEISEWLDAGCRLPATKMREIHLFLKRHGVTLTETPHNETMAAGVFNLMDALIEKGWTIRNLEDDSRYTN